MSAADYRRIRSEILRRLSHCAGNDRVGVSWEVRTPEGETRGVATSTQAADRDAQAHTDSVHLGDQLALTISVPQAGHIHLFNLGTDGRIEMIYPTGSQCSHVTGEHSIPGDLISEAELGGLWRETGPASAALGFDEGILALWTRHDLLLDPRHLHRDLPTGTRGGMAPALAMPESVFELPAEDWAFGLVFLRVLAEHSHLSQ